MKLIDANALMNVIQKNDYMLTANHNSMAPGMFTSGIRQAVDEAPTIDPVKHGYWIDRGEAGFFCSVCGGGCLLNYESDYCKSDCCPHCGTRLDIRLPEEEKSSGPMANRPYEMPQGKGAW